VRCVEAFALYDPRGPGVAANAKANGGCRGDNAGICRVRAHLMNVAVDLYGGLPGSSAIHGTRNASHVNVGEQDAPVRVGRDRANTQRWSNTLSIHDRRTSKPGIPPGDVVETVERVEHTARMAQPQHACIVCSDVDGVSNSHTARKLEVALSDGCPFAARGTPAQRMSADNGERTSASIRGEPSDGLVHNLLRAPIAGHCEQPIAPRGHKYRWFPHGISGADDGRWFRFRDSEPGRDRK